MKAYLVYTWSGEYEQYGEYDQKYFLKEESARKYEKELEEADEKDRQHSIKAHGHDKFYHAGVIFEEIEIVED
jgi:hypothetical protein